MQWSVFVTSVKKSDTGPEAVVEASNGSPDGPPFARFEIPPHMVEDCRIGKRYRIIVEDPDKEDI